MGNFPKVSPGQGFRPSAAKENAVSDMLNSLGFTGGVTAPAVTVDRLTVQIRNAGTASITAGQPVPLIAPESGVGEVRAVTAFEVKAEGSSAIRYGVATSDIRPGGRGSAIIHGVALTVLPSGISAGDRIGASGSGWEKDESGLAVVLTADSSGRALIYLGDASPAPGYNGYFKLILTGDRHLLVVDGGTYEQATGTSGNSICRVNNRSFALPATDLGVVSYVPRTVYLKFDAENNSVTAELGGSAVPDDTEFFSYYQIGRVIRQNDGYKVLQDHCSGVPQMWWSFVCQ